MTSPITAAIVEYGAKNILVTMGAIPLSLMGIIPGVAFEASGDPEIRTNFTIGTRYTPGKPAAHDGWREDYKVELVPVQANKFGKKSMYTSDFSTIWAAGNIRVFVIQQDEAATTYRELKYSDFVGIDLNKGLYD